MKKYKILDKFSGYSNKKDVTNLGATFMISPSQNVFINDGEKVSIRPGYEIKGESDSSLSPIKSSYTWLTSGGTLVELRSKGELLQMFSESEDKYIDIKDGFTDGVGFNYAEWWDDTEKLDKLIFVNGTSSMFEWNGAMTTFKSATSTTITKNGTTTFAEDRFYITSNKKVMIGGVEYTYTGGEGTTTLTGVTPSPASAGLTDGDLIYQSIVENVDVISATFNISLVRVLSNQAYIASLVNRVVYVSKITSYKDFTTASPRVPGGAEELTLDANPLAIIPSDKEMYISAGENFWYETRFTLSSDLTKETLEIKKLKTGQKQGAVGQSSVANIQNDIVFVPFEKTANTLGNIADYVGERSLPLSDAVKILFSSLSTVQNPVVKYHKNQIWFSFPSSSTVLIYDIEREYWQPPWTMSIASFTEKNGDLIGHSSVVSESYKLNTGNSDNGLPINAIARFAYRNYGDRATLKDIDHYFTEGYINLGTTLKTTWSYDYEGFIQTISKDIEGGNPKLVYKPKGDASLGKISLGKNGLGSLPDGSEDNPKFRANAELRVKDFYEMSVAYSTNQLAAEWSILAHGGNAKSSNTQDTHIKI